MNPEFMTIIQGLYTSIMWNLSQEPKGSSPYENQSKRYTTLIE